MAGGVGSRFWPYSRNAQPKQFLDILSSGKSLLRMTFERFARTIRKDNILVVTNEKYSALVQEQLPEIDSNHVLSEPSRRNTAPCIAYASYKILSKDPEAVMVVTPADHVIFQEEKFAGVIQSAVDASSGSSKLVTVGIKPNRPETGYGYIQYTDQKEGELSKVKTFTEKPELSLAKKFMASGDFVWNAGIFVWSVQAIIDSFKKYLPDMAETFAEGLDKYDTNEEQVFINHIYSHCESISIDYGILEKSSDVYVIRGDFDWSDLGSWSSLHEMREKDEKQNVIDANAIVEECQESIVLSETDRLIVLDDLDGYLVGDFNDVLIVCKKDNEAKFREYVARAKSKAGEKYL